MSNTLLIIILCHCHSIPVFCVKPYSHPKLILLLLPTLRFSIKSQVIQQWLAGYQRDKIAFDSGISAGAVTNIVNEWRIAMGSYTADALRDLAVTLRKIGTSPAQCAVGFRIATILRRLGVQEDKFPLLADISSFPKLYAVVIKLLGIDGSNNNNGVEGLNLLADKVRMCGGIKAAN